MTSIWHPGRPSAGPIAAQPADLAEQLGYYRARAAEYDEWWFRRGRYDRGPNLNARWFEEAAELDQTLAGFGPRGRVLELACGTGLRFSGPIPVGEVFHHPTFSVDPV